MGNSIENYFWEIEQLFWEIGEDLWEIRISHKKNLWEIQSYGKSGFMGYGN